MDARVIGTLSLHRITSNQTESVMPTARHSPPSYREPRAPPSPPHTTQAAPPLPPPPPAPHPIHSPRASAAGGRPVGRPEDEGRGAGREGKQLAVGGPL